jgi:hypothetical protein
MFILSHQNEIEAKRILKIKKVVLFSKKFMIQK